MVSQVPATIILFLCTDHSSPVIFTINLKLIYFYYFLLIIFFIINLSYNNCPKSKKYILSCKYKSGNTCPYAILKLDIDHSIQCAIQCIVLVSTGKIYDCALCDSLHNEMPLNSTLDLEGHCYIPMMECNSELGCSQSVAKTILLFNVCLISCVIFAGHRSLETAVHLVSCRGR